MAKAHPLLTQKSIFHKNTNSLEKEQGYEYMTIPKAWQLLPPFTWALCGNKSS